MFVKHVLSLQQKVVKQIKTSRDCGKQDVLTWVAANHLVGLRTNFAKLFHFYN